MDTSLLNNKFERIGARVKFSERFARSGVSLNIQTDRLGEYFDVAQPQRSQDELPRRETAYLAVQHRAMVALLLDSFGQLLFFPMQRDSICFGLID